MRARKELAVHQVLPELPTECVVGIPILVGLRDVVLGLGDRLLMIQLSTNWYTKLGEEVDNSFLFLPGHLPETFFLRLIRTRSVFIQRSHTRRKVDSLMGRIPRQRRNSAALR